MLTERTIKSCESCGYSLRETTIEAIAVIETTCTCPNCGEQAKHFLFTEQRNLPDEPSYDELKMKNFTVGAGTKPSNSEVMAMYDENVKKEDAHNG